MYGKRSAYGDDYHYIPVTSVNSGIGMELKQDLYSYTIQIVNIHFARDPATEKFFLIDAGMPHSAHKIIDII